MCLLYRHRDHLDLVILRCSRYIVITVLLKNVHDCYYIWRYRMLDLYILSNKVILSNMYLQRNFHEKDLIPEKSVYFYEGIKGSLISCLSCSEEQLTTDSHNRKQILRSRTKEKKNDGEKKIIKYQKYYYQWNVHWVNVAFF